MQHHFRMIVIFEDLVLFLLFIILNFFDIVSLSNIWRRQDLFSLLMLGILGDLSNDEFLSASTEISKQIRDFSELLFDLLYPERGIQGFYPFLGVKHIDHVALIFGLSHCWHAPEWTIFFRRRVVWLKSYSDSVGKVLLPIVFIVRSESLEIFDDLASSEHKVSFILAREVDLHLIVVWAIHKMQLLESEHMRS